MGQTAKYALFGGLLARERANQEHCGYVQSGHRRDGFGSNGRNDATIAQVVRNDARIQSARRFVAASHKYAHCTKDPQSCRPGAVDNFGAGHQSQC